MAISRRLIYGFLSQSSDAYNLTVPWKNSERDGLFQMNYSLEKSVTDNFKTWFKTNWGERPMRFYLGLDSARLLFEPESIAKEKFLNTAREQIKRYFGFLKIKKLEVITSGEDTSLADNTIRFNFEATFQDDENKQVKISEEIGL